MNVQEIIFLFKASSWLFSHVYKKDKKENDNKDEDNKDDNNEDYNDNNDNDSDEEFKKNKNEINKIFEKRNINRKLIGIMAKYIIDIGRCKCLIDRGFKKVLYLKYCSTQ